ncbi:phage tail protein [Neisseria subflava]|uniref:Tail fiber protein n=1 Tax=Neisseria subflava TaxID=28449 RepID=A0A9X9HYN1_NEISU|nr:phage tail protein [Neisseria subflava]UTG72278.1 tail fiber protein [Neisseria subflava]
MLTGNQTVGGKKTFSESTDFSGGLRISGNNTEQWSGFYRGNADWYWNNPIAGKALQFNDDGTLALSGDKILLYTHRSNAVNLDRDDKIATSKAVKIVNDKIEQAAPSGEVAYFAGRNAPAGWLKANGAAVSRTTYADLFAAIGTNYGAGDGRTTFNLPDLRGEFIRSWDDGRGIDSGRVFGGAQSDAIRNITGEIGLIQRTDINEYVAPSGAFKELRKVSGYIGSGGVDDWLTITNFSASNVVPTAAENRPRNIALLACIKA